MADDITINVKVAADRALKNAERLLKTLDRIEANYGKLGKAVDRNTTRFNNAMDSQVKSTERLQKASTRLGGTFEKIASRLGGFSGKLIFTAGRMELMFTIVERLYGRISDLVSSLYNANNAFLSTRNSLLVAAGGMAGANKQMQFLLDTARQLKIDVTKIGPIFSNFAASAKLAGANIGQIQKIFKSFSTAARVLNLDASATEGIFRALSQMFSKGKVQAEELRGQLGERLPGAFSLAAKAMGVTTEKLDKMLEQGVVRAIDLLPKLSALVEGEFGKNLPAALDTTSARLQAMSSEWNQLKSNIFGSAKGMTDAVLAFGQASFEAINQSLFGTRDLVLNQKELSKSTSNLVPVFENTTSSFRGYATSLQESIDVTNRLRSAQKGLVESTGDFGADAFNQGIVDMSNHLQKLIDLSHDTSEALDSAIKSGNVSVAEALKNGYADLQGRIHQLSLELTEAARATASLNDQQEENVSISSEMSTKVDRLLQSMVKQISLATLLKQENVKAGTAQAKVSKLVVDGLSKESAQYGVLIKVAKQLDSFQKKATVTRVRLSKSLVDNSKSLKEFTLHLNQQAKLVSLNSKEQQLYSLDLEEYNLVQQLTNKITKDTKSSLEDLNKAYVDGIAAIDKYISAKRKAVNDKEAEKQAKLTTKVLKGEAKEWEKIYDDFGKGVGDVFGDIFTGAFDSFSDFGSALEKEFKGLLKSLISQSVANPIQLFFGGVGGAGGAGGSGGIGGLFDSLSGGLSKITDLFSGGPGGLLGKIGNMFSGSGSITSGLNSLIGGLGGPSNLLSGTNGALGLGAAGGGLLSSLISDNPDSGLTGSILGGIGSAIGGPLGAALGGALGGVLSNAFGDENRNSDLVVSAGQHQTSDAPGLRNTDFGRRSMSFTEVNTPFGQLAAFGNNIGHPDDEQISQEDFQKWLDGMQELFLAFNEVDKSIVQQFKVSEKSIDIITEAIRGLEVAQARMSEPDFGQLIVDRYKIIFGEVSDIASGLFDQLTAGVTESDKLITAATIVTQTVTNIDALRNVAENVDKAIEASKQSSFEMLAAGRENFMQLVEQYNGTAGAASSLASGLAEQRQASEGLLLVIKQFSDSINQTLESTKERIILSNLDDQGKFNFFKEQADGLSAALETMTDPKKINETVNRINDLVNKTWDIQRAAGTEEAQAKQQEYLEYLDRINNLAQERLAVAESDTIDQAAAMATAVEQAITRAAAPISQSANATSNAANRVLDAADSFAQSVSDFASVAGNLNVNVQIDQA